MNGIPFRRGYLFYGPCRIVFGLALFALSLLEPSFTERELASLFRKLPPRCIVLLEDIDAVGRGR